MSGALFVITVPTEDEEKRLRQKVRFDTRVEYSTTSLPRMSKTKGLEKQDTPSCKSMDIQYGTFNKNSTGNFSPNRADAAARTISIDIDEKSARTSKSKNRHNLNGNVDCSKDQLNFRKSWEGLKEIVSSNRKDIGEKKKKDSLFELDISADSPMEIVLKEILKKFKIENSTWTKTNTAKSFQVVFTMEYDEKFESLQHKLNNWGIGDREGSTVSILHCTTFHTHQKDCDFDEENSAAELNAQKQSAWNRFMNTLTARLNVAQIIKTVRQDATITFDFVVLVVCAAILASFGLVEDSTIFLASSMLVSPLMGPIIAAIFGTAIKDQSLHTLGVVNELLGIAMATFVGFLFGLIVCTIDDRYGIGEGLSTEMLARCELHSVIVGILTAIPSGAAAAVGILGGNIGSLVGVAISASLLPPAVNSGLLWALACIYLAYETDGTRYNNVVKTNFYSNHQAAELAILGAVSMCVTITNVICVYGMGIIVLKIKEIAPLVSNSRQFWKHDIKIAREINKNCLNEDSVLANEIAALPDEEKEVLGLNSNLFRSINIEKTSYQNTWSPMGTRHALSYMENRPTLQDFERIYLTMTHPLQDHGKYSSRSNMSVSLKGRTPQKKFSIAEHIPAFTRRASMPFDNLSKSPKSRFNTLSTYRNEPMEQIAEIHFLPDPDISTDKQPPKTDEEKKTRKFTITPASENI